MKAKFYYLLLSSLLLMQPSCKNSDDLPQQVCSSKDNMGDFELRRDSSVSIRKILPFVETEEIKYLRKTLSTKEQNFSRDISPFQYNNEDYYLSSNMRAIREMPINIKVRDKDLYLSSNGKGRAVTMANKDNSRPDERFFLKVFPPSSGIPYVIYSMETDTPLSVGRYYDDPSSTILFARESDATSGSELYNSSWHIKPVEGHRGYFYIESNSYLGQSDPNNMWSVFNYVVEDLGNRQVGFGEYAHKAEQEFMITPCNKFNIDYIEFHKEASSVTLRTPLKVVSYTTNDSDEETPFTINAVKYAEESYYFEEKSLLTIPVLNTNTKFYRPNVVARKVVPPSPVKPEDDPSPIRPEPDMTYSTLLKRIPQKLSFEINGSAKPNSLVEVTSYLENYDVSISYTAHMSYRRSHQDIRKVKVIGTWHGTIYSTKRDSRYPKDLIKCFDLDDGEELQRLHPIVLLDNILK